MIFLPQRSGFALSLRPIGGEFAGGLPGGWSGLELTDT